MSRARLLIVDDSQNIRDVLATNFDYLGYEVRTARDGAEALSMVAQEKPDVLILDVMMPEQNGYQVCRRIKSDPALAHIPIVFLSARGRNEDRFWGRDCGAEDYLTKPFSTSDLEEVVERLLARDPVGRTPVQEPAAARGDAAPASEVLLTLKFDPRPLTVFRQKYGEPKFAEVRDAVRRIVDRMVREQTGRDPVWLTGHRTLRALLPDPGDRAALCERITTQANVLLRGCYDAVDSARGYVVARNPDDAREEHVPLLSLDATLAQHGERKAS